MGNESQKDEATNNSLSELQARRKLVAVREPESRGCTTCC